MPTFFEKKGYEWTNQFFNSDLPSLLWWKPKVVEQFSKYSGLMGKELRASLQPGYIPSIQLKYIGMYGYTPPTGDTIFLGKTFVDELEDALEWRGPRNPDRYTPTIRESDLLLILEATVLHELVHYFRRKFNEQARLNMASSRGRDYEEAVARKFEKETYGKYMTVQNMNLAHCMPKTAALGK